MKEVTENITTKAVDGNQCYSSGITSYQMIGSGEYVSMYTLKDQESTIVGPSTCAAANGELDLYRYKDIVLHHDNESQPLRANCDQSLTSICAQPLLVRSSQTLRVQYAGESQRREKFWLKNKASTWSTLIMACDQAGILCSVQNGVILIRGLKISIPVGGTKLIRGIWWQQHLKKAKEGYIHQIGKISFMVKHSVS